MICYSKVSICVKGPEQISSMCLRCFQSRQKALLTAPPAISLAAPPAILGPHAQCLAGWYRSGRNHLLWTCVNLKRLGWCPLVSAHCSCLSGIGEQDSAGRLSCGQCGEHQFLYWWNSLRYCDENISMNTRAGRVPKVALATFLGVSCPKLTGTQSGSKMRYPAPASWRRVLWQLCQPCKACPKSFLASPFEHCEVGLFHVVLHTLH